MDFQKEIRILQEGIFNRLDFLKAVVANLKRQSKRFYGVISRYKTQKSNDGIFGNIILNDPSFKDIEEYSELLNKQFAPRLEQLVNEVFADKIKIEKLHNDFKVNPKEDYKTRIEGLKNSMAAFEKQFTRIWGQEHFLALNYRLDIASKEIERWTSVMEAHKSNPQKISNTVESLFS